MICSYCGSTEFYSYHKEIFCEYCNQPYTSKGKQRIYQYYTGDLSMNAVSQTLKRLTTLIGDDNCIFVPVRAKPEGKIEILEV